jgi:hypothetical protein
MDGRIARVESKRQAGARGPWFRGLRGGWILARPGLRTLPSQDDRGPVVGRAQLGADEPGTLVRRRDVLDLLAEQAREDDRAAGRDPLDEHLAHAEENVGLDVGQDELERPRRGAELVVTPATPLRARFSSAAPTAIGSLSTATPAEPGQSFAAAIARMPDPVPTSRKRATRWPALSSASIASRTSRVDRCAPVPNARPGSSASTTSPATGA